MATQIPNFYTINGVIDTSKSVLENMNLLAEASGCWMSYDINEGKWAVIINNTGSSVASFNDSNILGSVNITSPGLTEVYNTVEMQFPHKDLIDEPDYVTMSVTAGNRYPNEPDNVLSINSQLINNQAQAQSIAGRQLKQSRIDKIINFQADYSYIGLKAGDLISVTNSVYSWTNKVFRIISIQEQSADDGNIIMDITALEYDAGVYSTADLQITPRNTQNGITASYLNSSVVNSNNNFYSKSVASPEGAIALAEYGFLISVGSFVTNQINIAKFTGDDLTFMDSFASTGSERYDLNYQTTLEFGGTYSIEYIINFGADWDYDGGNMALLPDTSRKRVRINITRNGNFVNLPTSITSIIKGSDPLQDITTVAQFTGTAGDVIEFYLDCRQDLGSGNFVDLPYCWVVVSATLQYLGP